MNHRPDILPAKPTKAYRCFHCGICEADGYATSEGLPICLGCGDVCETLHMCACGEREAHDGCDECVQCIADSAEEHPQIVDGLYGSLLKEVAAELARRHAPYLRQRQAG